jgi:hypothetical protein
MTTLQIANAALAELGSQRITTLDDATEPARLCKANVASAIKEILELGKWKAARAQAELTQNTSGPDFGWDYSYNLPADYLRMVTFNEVDSDDVIQELFERQGNILLTDEDEVSIVYVKDLTVASNDVNLMGPLLTRCCILNLAIKLSIPLTNGSRAARDGLANDLEIALRKAKAANAGESFQPTIDPASGSRWIPSRF